MKRVRLDQWATQLQPPRNPRLHLHRQRCPYSPDASQLHQRNHHHIQHQWQCQRRGIASIRKASSVANQAEETGEVVAQEVETAAEPPQEERRAVRGKRAARAPSHRQAQQSAKLSALHSRLSLPSKLPLQTLARCLIDPTVDSRPGFNNAPLALLGQELLGLYTAEWLLCRYPRLPMPILFAAQYAYVGGRALGAMRSEWGVETVAAPGPEVDPGLLQLQRTVPGNAMAEGEMMQVKDLPQAKRVDAGRRRDPAHYRRGMSSRIVHDDQFGDTIENSEPFPGAPISTQDTTTTAPTSLEETSPISTTVEAASASFVRALTGALYLHAGTSATKAFHRDHVLSRHLPLHNLFNFAHPTRDLSRLCAREGFEPPVARLISETGRLSRTPVFVVGVFSGDDKLGEGAGSSLNAGRVRAAAAALQSWYLYSPPEGDICLPSEDTGRKWKPQMVDIGEIVT